MQAEMLWRQEVEELRLQAEVQANAAARKLQVRWCGDLRCLLPQSHCPVAAPTTALLHAGFVFRVCCMQGNRACALRAWAL